MDAAVKRLWEVDASRGMAILMMLVSNFLFDLVLFANCSWCYSGFWLYFARLTAGLFILLAGVSLTLSFSRVREKPKKGVFAKYLKRGLKLFSLGLLITAATFFFFREKFIVFGILHLIGISVILSLPFLRRKFLSFLSGVAVILVGFFLETITISFPWLLWLGLKPQGFDSVDYTPLFPWFGVFLIGIFLGNLLFPQGKRKQSSGWVPSFIRGLAFLGRHSLKIYLLHQPVFVAALWLYLGGIPL